MIIVILFKVQNKKKELELMYFCAFKSVNTIKICRNQNEFLIDRTTAVVLFKKDPFIFIFYN